MDLYEQVQRWIWSKGIDQWTSPDGDNAAQLARVRVSFDRAIQARECYVAELGGKVVGAMVVDDDADPEFWSAADEPASALYIHRMMASRAPEARGVGTALVKAATELARSKRRPRLRLDAWQTNTALHEYYKQQGFTHLRTHRYSHRGSGALFERDVSPVSPVSPADT